jgi:hypothetical protein
LTKPRPGDPRRGLEHAIWYLIYRAVVAKGINPPAVGQFATALFSGRACAARFMPATPGKPGR